MLRCFRYRIWKTPEVMGSYSLLKSHCWHLRNQFMCQGFYLVFTVVKQCSSQEKSIPGASLHCIPKRCKKQEPQTLQKRVHVEEVLVRGLCLAEGLQSLRRRDGKKTAPTLGLQFLSCLVFLGVPSLLCCLSLTEQEKVIPKRSLASSAGFTTEHYS